MLLQATKFVVTCYAAIENSYAGKSVLVEEVGGPEHKRSECQSNPVANLSCRSKQEWFERRAIRMFHDMKPDSKMGTKRNSCAGEKMLASK